MKANERFCVNLTKYANQDSFFDTLNSISVPTITWEEKNSLFQGEEGIIFNTLDSIPEIGLSSQLRIPTIADLFCNSNSFLWGSSNTGKSFLAIALACSMTTGDDFYFIKNSLPMKVGYLDGEISGEDFKARIIQMKGKAFAANPLLLKNLIHCDLHGKRLSDEKVQNEICAYFKKNNTTHVIIDNLLSTFPKAAQGSIEAFAKFIEKLRSNGNGITVVHHANKEGKDFKGPTDFESLSQNVIRLYNPDQLLELSEKKGLHLPDNIRDDINLGESKNEQKPVVMMAKVVKCKASRALEDRKFFFVLPIQGDLQCYDENGKSFSLPNENYSNGSVPVQPMPNTNEVNEKNQKLSPIPKKSTFEMETEVAFDKIKAKFGNNEFKTTEILELLGCQKDKALKIINSLIEKGQMEAHGSGNQKRYQLIIPEEK